MLVGALGLNPMSEAGDPPPDPTTTQPTVLPPCPVHFVLNPETLKCEELYGPFPEESIPWLPCELDPLCDEWAPPAASPKVEEGMPWKAIAIGGGVIIVVGVAVGLVLRSRGARG